MASMNLNGSPRKSLWKGKAKATEEDFEDLNPVITYRHLLSQNLGVRDPLRVIALCDSDAFYAACEMNRLGVDTDTPLVVLQWDALIAVNYPARKFGISRMDKKKDALKRCPHLKVVHVATYKEGEAEPGYWDDIDTNTHKVSLDYYRRESLKIATLFKEILPGCEVEKASIDEAFIDFTKPVRELLLQRYPYLAQVPPAAPEEKSITEENANDSVQSPQKNYVRKEGETKESEPPATWHDVALSIAAELMGAAKEEVRLKLGYTTSAGISRNKFLAKLTASYKKFNSQSILRNSAIPKYLKPMQFQKIRFLGGKLGDAIAKEYDASTVGDLLTISLEEMQNKFGENSVWIYEVLRGIDRNEVKDKGSTLNKSMLASKNLPKPITKASEGYHWIRVLAAELALRLRDAREMSPNLWPKTLVLHARKGYQAGRSKQAPFPFTRDLTVDIIALAGDKLWKELVGNNTTLNVTSVQLAFTGIDVAEAGQSSIEGFLKPVSSKKRPRDSPEVNIDSHHGGPNSDKTHPNNDNSSKFSYICSRCGMDIAVPTTEDSNDHDDIFTKAKMEHDDFHFAQDLAHDSQPKKIVATSSKAAISESKPTKKRKSPPGPKGIEKFFRK
ncbi:DNA/RNA polymerase [Pholiota conissans]|uniref:DNA polymerase eta n=1 Tax=Pholiota conissans TaxID=109636 RepID=A0A9P5YJD8_9AGAR|nr:DNA/RNA polymerase [Pholiota conissans]